jgi:hypothetical protein
MRLCLTDFCRWVFEYKNEAFANSPADGLGMVQLGLTERHGKLFCDAGMEELYRRG